MAREPDTNFHYQSYDHVAERLDAHRVLVGVILLAMLSVGLWGYFPLIVDEWPRLDDWQKAAIWIGDVTAVLLVLRWALMPMEDPFDEWTEDDVNEAKRQMYWITFTLMFSLSLDIGNTLFAIYQEKVASERSLVTTATVTEVAAIPWKPVMHYRLRVQFEDAAGQRQSGLIVFTKKKEGFPPWVDGTVQQAIAQKKTDFPMEIRYDPKRPARVWGKNEDWNRGQALAYVFAITHLFQIIVVGSLSVGIWVSKEFHPTPLSLQLMPMLALTVQAGVVALFGPLYRLRGF